MELGDSKEVELAKRGVDAFVDRANELHHQGRHVEALKQLEVRMQLTRQHKSNVRSQRARRLCEKKLGPMHSSTVKVRFILSSMRDSDGSMRKPTDTNLHFVTFDALTEKILYHNYLELARIIRKRAYVDELGVAVGIEFDSLDGLSRHSLGLYGDAPVSYARWRIDSEWAIVDRLCTLQAYRFRGVARTCLQNIVRDVCLFASRQCLSLHGLVVHVPQSYTMLKHKLEEAKFVPLAEPCMDHVLSTRMCLPLCLPVIAGSLS